jgi:hypothetical protein
MMRSEGSIFMISTPFTLRSDLDLLDTFRSNEQTSVVLPKDSLYPIAVKHYHAWSEPSGVYTYLVFKRADWEAPFGLVFQRNGGGSSASAAGMCDWCHHSGPSDEVGLLTTSVSTHVTGGTWLCLDLHCLQRIEARTGSAAKNREKLIERLCKKIGEFYQRVRLDGNQ